MVTIQFCVLIMYQMSDDMSLCSKCLSNMHSPDGFPTKETIQCSFETTMQRFLLNLLKDLDHIYINSCFFNHQYHVVLMTHWFSRPLDHCTYQMWYNPEIQLENFTLIFPYTQNHTVSSKFCLFVFLNRRDLSYWYTSTL